MAWDNDRPYAAFGFDGNMIEVGRNVTPTNRDIDYLYECETNVLPVPWPKNWIGNGSAIGVWHAFKDVPLMLAFVGVAPHHDTTYLWHDTKGHTYFMFQSELLRLLHKGVLAPAIEGRWSAVKRGSHYGIELLDDGDTQ